jgi:hypothetical protein
MKSEPKAFASLSSGLLARKGAARPAMRPQGFGQSGAGLEDLGWNDMGFEAPKATAMPLRDASHDAFGDEIAPQPLRNPLAALSPVQSPVHSQQAELVERLAPLADEVDEDGYDDTAELYDGADFATAEVFEPEQVYEPNLEVPAAPEPEFVVTEAEAEPFVRAPSAFNEHADAPAPIVATPVQRSKLRHAAKPRSAAGSKAKAAFTLRLDPARHLKLRLACAVRGGSAQQLVTDALDALLAGMPELEAMAAKANPKG